MNSTHEKSTREKFNFLKKYYDETWDNADHTLHVGVFRTKNDSLEKAYKQATEHLLTNIASIAPLGEDSVVLDVGCGTGRTLIEICAKYGCRGIGIDLSDEQIKDATAHLRTINSDRLRSGKPKLRAKYIRASGSDLEKSFHKNEQFTHIISQDAILLITNKQSFFENVYRLLAPGGIFAVADFLSETSTDKISKTEHNLIYKLVNWNEALSFNAYQTILKTVGLQILKTERRDSDMVLTYSKLSQSMSQYVQDKDKTYGELQDRYASIASAVKNGKMGWGFFFAQKPARKTALIAGTKSKSIGRYIAKHLHSLGWEVWLYSRSAKHINKANWHERACDISSEKSIQKLIGEIHNIDLVMMLADSGKGHEILEGTRELDVKELMNAKLTGSVLLSKALIQKFPKHDVPLKMIWCAGTTSRKPKDLILYAIVNSGIASFVSELNSHYKQLVEAYYLPTGIISPSTLGDAFIRKGGPKLKRIAEHPKTITDKVMGILEGKNAPGMLENSEKIV
ncbi:MAG: SDR family NAD(P)-dependent oxidoreductase [Candidatus Uhrbacteria bacterium]